jgi:hypothetical protein
VKCGDDGFFMAGEVKFSAFLFNPWKMILILSLNQREKEMVGDG